MYKKFSGLFLVLCALLMCVSTAMAASDGEYWAYLKSDASYVNHVNVTGASSEDDATGGLHSWAQAVTGLSANIVRKDLNDGAGGDYIYLGFTDTQKNPNYALTGLRLLNVPKEDKLENPPKTYTADGVEWQLVEYGTDLNDDAGGDYIYLYYTDEYFYDFPIVDIGWCGTDDASVLEENQYPVLNFNGEWLNVNNNADGKEIYLYVEVGMCPVDLDLLNDLVKKGEAITRNSGKVNPLPSLSSKIDEAKAMLALWDYPYQKCPTDYKSPSATYIYVNNMIRVLTEMIDSTNIYISFIAAENGGYIDGSSNGNYGTTVDIGANPNVKYTIPHMTVTKEGYEFVGWNTNKNAHDGLPAGTEVTLDQNTIYYAIFKKDVTGQFSFLDQNGNTVTREVTGACYNKDSKATFAVPADVPATVNPKDFGKALTFAGWNSECVAAAPAFPADSTSVTGEDASAFYATYTTPLTLRFDTSVGSTLEPLQATQYVAIGEPLPKVTFTLNAEPTAPDGYLFAGWATKEGDEVAFKTDDTVKISIDTTLYAVYQEKTYTAIITNGTGGGTYKRGDTVTITANAAPNGQHFKEWTVTNGNVTLANAASATTTFIMPASDVTVEAMYEETRYTVSYNANGGTGSVPTDSNAYATGDSVTVLFDPAPTRDGYSFLGWSTDQDATAPMYSANGTASFAIAADTTLFAVWDKKQAVNVASVTIGGDVTYHTDLQSAFDAAASGTDAAPATVTLLADMIITNKTPDDFVPSFAWKAGTGSLDLNGKTIEMTYLSDSFTKEHCCILLAGGNLTICDSSGGGVVSVIFYSADSSGPSTVKQTAGTLTLKSGRLSNYGFSALGMESGSFVMDGGKLENDAKTKAVIMAEDSKVDVHINGGEIHGLFGLSFASEADVEITGGKIYGESNLLAMSNTGTLDISGGTFTCPSPSEYGKMLWMSSMVKSNITGGTFVDGFHVYDVDLNAPAFVQRDLNTVLPDGYAFKKADGTFVNLTEGQTEIGETVTVTTVPIRITQQPVDTTITVGETRYLQIATEPLADTYTWYMSRDGGESFTKLNATFLSSQPIQNTSEATYQYYCVVTKDGYQLKSNTVTVKVKEDPSCSVTVLYGEQSIPLKMQRNDTIDAIKTKLQEKLGVPPYDQRLYYKGQLLEEGKTLKDYGITSGTELVMKTTPPDATIQRSGGTAAAFDPDAWYGSTDAIIPPTGYTVSSVKDAGFAASLPLSSLLTAEGAQTVTYYLKDNDYSYVTAKTFESLKYDGTAPVITLNGSVAVGDVITVTASAEDALSGVNGSPLFSSASANGIANGNVYTFTGAAQDNAVTQYDLVVSWNDMAGNTGSQTAAISLLPKERIETLTANGSGLDPVTVPGAPENSFAITYTADADSGASLTADGKPLTAGSYSYTLLGQNGCLAHRTGTVVVSDPAPSVFTITLPDGSGYVIAPVTGSASPVTQGGSYSFTVTAVVGYDGSAMVVKANGHALTAADGVYTISNITADQSITVEGVVKKSDDASISSVSVNGVAGTMDPASNTIYVVLPAGSTIPTELSAVSLAPAAGASLYDLHTPDNGATWTFTIVAADGTTREHYTIKVSVAAAAPVITTTALADGTVGTAYSQTLTATGDAPITWSVKEGTALPDGLTLDSATGVISGTPTAAGTAEWTAVAANAGGSAEKALSITIAAAPLTSTITWVNDNGEVLETDTNVVHGTMPSYDGAAPAKAADAQYTYTFAGWTPDVVSVTGDATYTARFADSTNTYTVTWLNEDGTELEKDEHVPYGTMPAYNGATPAKAADAQYAYTFAGWTPDVVSVTGDVTYTATFTVDTTLPVIISQPQDQYVTEGQRATFTIDARGDGLTCQWYINRNQGAGWQLIDGATRPDHTTKAVDLACDGFQYRCIVTDMYGHTLQSDAARVQVSATPALPETGDNSHPLLYLSLLLTSLAGILLLKKKRVKA